MAHVEFALAPDADADDPLPTRSPRWLVFARTSACDMHRSVRADVKA